MGHTMCVSNNSIVLVLPKNDEKVFRILNFNIDIIIIVCIIKKRDKDINQLILSSFNTFAKNL